MVEVVLAGSVFRVAVYAVPGVLVSSLFDCGDLEALDPSVCLVDVDVDVDDGAEQRKLP